MKKTNLFLGIALVVLVIAMTLMFNSCKKDSNSNTNEQTAISAAEDIQITDNVDIAVDNIDNSVNSYFSSSKSMSDFTDNCTTITATAALSYPRIFTFNYGTDCSINEVTFGGTVEITYSAALWTTGFKKTFKFTDFYINGNKINGQKTVTFTGSYLTGDISYTETHDLSILTSAGTITSTGTRTISRTEGKLTPLYFFDDVYQITGSNTGTSAKGISFNTVIDLKRKFGYRFPISGTRVINTPTTIVSIDYGDGTSDNKATRSINGGSSVEITLK